MDTKMEKLKETKSDNLLTEEEMEEVTGGNCKMLSDDSKFLNVLLQGRPGQPNRYGDYQMDRDEDGKMTAEVVRAWATLGIVCDPHREDRYKQNEYSLNGKSITQDQAYKHAMKVVGKRLLWEDWAVDK